MFVYVLSSMNNYIILLMLYSSYKLVCDFSSEQLLVLFLRHLCSLVGNRDLSYVLKFKGTDLCFKTHRYMYMYYAIVYINIEGM